MAGSDSDSSSGGGSQLPNKPEATTFSIKINTKLPRRQLTLISITALLNVLLWSSLICLISALFQIASDPEDTTNIPSEVLTLTSALVSIAYILLHTIFSLKQRIWKHQRRHPSIIKKTSYVAIRLAVSLCVLWLLTSGWNMITVARRPVCLPEGPGLQGWEAGTTCQVGRLSIAFALIALMASCTLFGMLAIVRRPFEAHLLKHGYRKEPINPNPTPGVSRGATPSRMGSFYSDRWQQQNGRVSASTHRSTPSNVSNTDVETLDLNSTSPPSTIHAPSPVRSIGLGIFTSHMQPPPVPPAFAIPPRGSSLETPPPIFYPSASNQHLPPPPRMSALVAPSGFVPLSIPAQYSASAWRAVHPTVPSPLGPVASRSHPHLPHTNSNHNFSYRSRYSRSSVSITRPHRLSSATPVAVSSRSSSTGPEERRGSLSDGSGEGRDRRAAANEIAYAILNGTAIPGTEPKSSPKHGHIRRASAPAPDTTCGAQEMHTAERKAKGWRPNLASPTVDQGENQGEKQSFDSPVVAATRIVRSSSAELLSRFNPERLMMRSVSDQSQSNSHTSSQENEKESFEFPFAAATKIVRSSSTELLSKFSTENMRSVRASSTELLSKFNPEKLIRSSSSELLSKFSPDSSPDDDRRNIKKELERELDAALSIVKNLPFRKSRSESHFRYAEGHTDIPGNADKVSGMPRDPGTSECSNATGSRDVSGESDMDKEKWRMTFDEVKNKPLPRIAAL